MLHLDLVTPPEITDDDDCPSDAYLRSYHQLAAPFQREPLYPNVRPVRHIARCSRCQTRLHHIGLADFHAKEHEALEKLFAAGPVGHHAALRRLFVVAPKRADRVGADIQVPEFHAIAAWLRTDDASSASELDRASFLREVLLAYPNADVCRRVRDALRSIGKTTDRKSKGTSPSAEVINGFWEEDAAAEARGYLLAASCSEEDDRWHRAGERLQELAPSQEPFPHVDAVSAHVLAPNVHQMPRGKGRWSAWWTTAGAATMAAAATLLIVARGGDRDTADPSASHSHEPNGRTSLLAERGPNEEETRSNDETFVNRRPPETPLPVARIQIHRFRDGTSQPLMPSDGIRAGDGLRIGVYVPATNAVNIWFLTTTGEVNRLLSQGPTRLAKGETVLDESVVVNAPCSNMWVVVGVGGGSTIETERELEQLGNGERNGNEWVPENCVTWRLTCE